MTGRVDPPTVLVCTSSAAADDCVTRVVDALRERGVHVHVLDGDRFPLDATIELGLDGPATLTCADQQLDLRAVRAVWLTHVELATALGDEVEADFHEAIAVQSELALWDVIAACERALLVDDPEAVARVPLGTAQLRLARAAGLEVPRSIVTNDPARVRSFADSLGGHVIAKLLHSSVVTRTSASGLRGYGPRHLGPDELADIDAVRLCPQLFQQPIAKQLEIRVTVVGARVFSAAVDTRDAAVLDWGDDPTLIAAFVPYDLPEPVARSILTLLDRLGLEFATVDLILTPEGRHVFLELNPISYFGFIERATKLPISDAIATLLAGDARPRRG